jgi:hypothetical protein
VYSAWTCSLEAWRNSMDMKHGHAVLANKLEMNDGQATCTFSVGRQYKHEVSTCSRDMQVKCSSRNAADKCSIDMQHGDMDMQRGQAAWTCNVYMQLEQAAWRHGEGACTRSMYMQHGQPHWHAKRIYIMDNQCVHAVKQAAWTRSRNTQGRCSRRYASYRRYAKCRHGHATHTCSTDMQYVYTVQYGHAV